MSPLINNLIHHHPYKLNRKIFCTGQTRELKKMKLIMVYPLEILSPPRISADKYHKIWQKILVTSIKWYQYQILSVSNTISIKYYQYQIVSVSNTISIKYYQYQILSVSLSIYITNSYAENRSVSLPNFFC